MSKEGQDDDDGQNNGPLPLHLFATLKVNTTSFPSESRLPCCYAEEVRERTPHVAVMMFIMFSTLMSGTSRER